MSIKKTITRIKYPLLAVLFAFALFSVTQAAMHPSDATDIRARRPNARWSSPHTSPSLLADNPISPTQPVKLIFIHHSTGGNWLADSGEHDQAGGLGQALMDNNYFVSATNYGWGPGSIGSNTDVPSWPDWFTGPSSSAILGALYAESGQNICGEDMCFGNWSRPETDPGGENEIIMFKSCFPNSDVYGNPGDPPASEPNGDFTVSNFKAVYNDLLTYFETRQDKLFIVITAPPMAEVSYVINDNSTPAADRAANARAFNTWLMNNWLDGYAYDNVAVFDFYNVLTSNGSASRIDDTSTREEPNDYDSRPDGNHHYWNGSEVVHPQTIVNNFSAYPYFSVDPAAPDPWSDDHPTAAGNQKATAEFVPLLNVFYNRWKSGAAPTPPALTLTAPASGATWLVNSSQQIQWTTTGSVPQVNLFYSADNFVTSQTITLSLNNNTNSYAWTTPLTPTTSARVRVESVVSPTSVADVSEAFTLYQPGVMDEFIYLPFVLCNYTPAPPACIAPLTGITISGPSSGYTNTLYTFSATPATAGASATTPIAYTWSPAPHSGQGTSSASYQWTSTGNQSINVTASNCSGTHSASDEHSINIQEAASGNLIQPNDLTYLGAFRLPGGDDPPLTFAYGGNAMTFDPSGDSGNGSLFIMGHDRQAWGGLPDGGQIAEISIPAPVSSTNLVDLNTASFIQTFSNVAAGYFTELEELPRTGMAYLDNTATGPKIHLSWGQHHEPDTPLPTYAWFDPDLSAPNLQGLWFIGEQNYYSLNGYMFEIPSSWADAHVGGRYLGAGRAMDGGWGGMGPTLFAYRPWQIDGSPEISGTHLSETTLLLYEDTQDNGDVVVGANTVDGHQHPDEWEGGEWLTTTAGKSAVLFIGNKGIGAKYWYGYRNPAGPEYPCVNTQAASEFTACRMASGEPCPAADMIECAGHSSTKGWWCAHFDARLVLYDPADLAQVAAGTMESWEPQPYNHLSIGEHLFDNPAGVDLEMLGEGIQRRYLFGDVAYDRDNGLLYVLELFADEAKPVVHVWRVD